MKLADGRRLFINEVAVRDGFQMEPVFVPTEDKIKLVNALSHTGLAKIEVTSFSSPKAIPALADAELVMNGIMRVPGVEYAVLVPNARGCERALACDVDEINLVMSASESHNQANLRMACAASLAQFAQVLALVHAHGAGSTRQPPAINASLSTSFGCPFEGEVPEARVLDLVERMAALGIQRISLCDTTGMANPAQVERLFRRVQAALPDLLLTAHFHNTRGMGLANVLAALEAGVTHFDASIGGLGGCPYAPGASGNVCTEDMVHMLANMGYDTGVQLDALIEAARTLPDLVGHDVPGQVLKAGPASKRYVRSAAAAH